MEGGVVQFPYRIGILPTAHDLLIDQQKIEKVAEFQCLGQTIHLKDITKEEIYARIRAAWSCFGKKNNNPTTTTTTTTKQKQKNKEYSKIDNSPFHLKNK